MLPKPKTRLQNTKTRLISAFTASEGVSTSKSGATYFSKPGQVHESADKVCGRTFLNPTTTRSQMGNQRLSLVNPKPICPTPY